MHLRILAPSQKFATVISMSFQRVTVQTTKKNSTQTADTVASRVDVSGKTAKSTSSFQPRRGSFSEGSPTNLEQNNTESMNQNLSQKSRRSEGKDMPKFATKKVITLAIAGAVVFGIVTGGAGAFISRQTSTSQVASDSTGTETSVIPDSAVKVGAVFGVSDQSTFSDDTEGVIILGGLAGEGSHTLLRPGGVSQNVYLTSSVVDLGQFENMRVRIWGETFKGQKAGWLMDVGRVEVMELGAELPEWYQKQQGQ